MPLTGARELCVGLGTTSRSSHVGVVALSARPEACFLGCACARRHFHVHAKDVSKQLSDSVRPDRTTVPEWLPFRD